jgi:hypothetical protein
MSRMVVYASERTAVAICCCSPGLPSTQLDGTHCDDWWGPFNVSAVGSASPAACEAVACASGAQTWQYCPGGGAACGLPSCFIGLAYCTRKNQTGWISAARNTSAPWAAPATAAAFDDSAWPVLDIPHDFHITGQYSSVNDRGEGVTGAGEQDR